MYRGACVSLRATALVASFASLASLTSGCVVYEYAAVGASTSATKSDGRTGGAFDFVGGMGRLGGPESPVALTLGSHFFIAERVTEAAPSIAVEASTRPLGGRVVPFAGLGVRPLALGLADGRPGSFGGRDFSFSVLSPQADLGLMFLVYREQLEALRTTVGYTLVLRASAQYDIRVTDQPSELFLAVTLGPGFYFSAF